MMFWKQEKDDLREVFPIENLPLEVLGTGNRDALSILYRHRDEKKIHSESSRIPLRSLGKTPERAGFLKKMLPILDGFDNVLKYGKLQEPDDEILDNWFKSLEAIYRRLIRVLEGEGLIVIESAGKPLDLTIHEVIETREVTGIRHNHVIEEIVKGYKCGNRVLRDAQVIVSKNPDNIGVGVSPGDDRIQHSDLDDSIHPDENQPGYLPQEEDYYN